jgi:hypothetical protein
VNKIKIAGISVVVLLFAGFGAKIYTLGTALLGYKGKIAELEAKLTTCSGELDRYKLRAASSEDVAIAANELANKKDIPSKKEDKKVLFDRPEAPAQANAVVLNKDVPAPYSGILVSKLFLADSVACLMSKQKSEEALSKCFEANELFKNQTERANKAKGVWKAVGIGSTIVAIGAGTLAYIEIKRK